MKLRIIMSSRVKDRQVEELASEYIKRTNAWAECSMQEIANSNPEKQAQALLKAGSGWLVGMDPAGKQHKSSEAFAEWLNGKLETHGGVTFYIGEADGLNKTLKKNADELISLTGLTMGHRICLVMLAEQLYRSMTIIKGHPYHK